MQIAALATKIRRTLSRQKKGNFCIRKISCLLNAKCGIVSVTAGTRQHSNGGRR
nr:MAG TPA: hypothetical protein [Caudoviricetes sp.]